MANIDSKLNAIKGAIYGADVRTSIADGIETINTEVESTTERQESLEDIFEELIINAGSSNAEIVAARGGEVSLPVKLNKIDSSLSEKANQSEVNIKASKSYVDDKVQGISLSYKESYDTLVLLQSAYPTGDINNHTVLADGLIYTYVNSNWISTGIQANGTGVPDNAIKINNMYEIVAEVGKNKFNKLGVLNEYPTGTFPTTVYDSVNDLIVTQGQSGVAYGQGQKIILELNTSYTISATAIGQDHKFCLLNQAGTEVFVSTQIVAGATGKLTFNSGSNAFLYLMWFTFSKTGTYGLQDVQIEKGSIATKYEDYIKNITKLFNSGIVDIKVRDDLSNLTDESTNLFNKNDKDIINHKYLDGSGVLVDSSNYFVSGKITVEKGDSFVFDNTTLLTNSLLGGYYTSADLFVSNVTGVVTDNHRTITVPSNNDIAYMKVNFDLSKIETFMIAKGIVFPSSYIQYKQQLNNKYGLNDTQKSQGNPLYGKKVLWNGDSITYGAGWRDCSTFLIPNNNSGWAKLITENNNMVGYGYGVGGATIAGETYLNGTIPMHWISRDVVNMEAIADYIIFQGGINDYYFASPMGTISAGYDATLDDTTFCGALESLFKQSQLKWQGKKIGFIITHKVWNTFSDVNKNLSELYWNKAREICEKWSIPYLDLFKESGLNTSLLTIRNNYTQHQTEPNGDGCHPNEKGYREFLAPKIEAWMKTL